MKKSKYMIAVLIIGLCFILTSEIFQNYLTMFTNEFYYFELSTNENRKEMQALIQETCKKYEVGVFAVQRETEIATSASYLVYADRTAAEVLQADYGIIDGEYRSFFAGKSEIKVVDFEKIIEQPSIERFYFTGTMEEVRSIRAEVYDSFATSYIHKEAASGLEWVIVGTWLIAVVFILVLTWYDIQFQKKENFIRISLGESRIKIILKNIAMDTTYFLMMITVLYEYMKKRIYIDYHKKEYSCFIILFLVLNMALYFSLYRYEYKKVLYGAVDNRTTLANCYILKVFTIILAIVSLSVCFELIVDNMQYLNFYDVIDTYEEYSFLGIQTKEKDPELVEQKENQILCELYQQGKAALAVSKFSDDEKNYIILNEKTIANVRGIWLENYQDSNSDLIVFVPSNVRNYSQAVEDATFTTSAFFGVDDTEMTYEVISYDKGVTSIYFDSTQLARSVTGFEIEKQPILIYCNITDKNRNKFSNVTEFSCGKTFQDVMFDLSSEEITALKDKYALEEISAMNAVERCEQFKESLVREVLMSFIIFMFMLVLECTLITAITRMEYLVNAKELAIKKILGYGIFEKNREAFLINIFAASIAIITIVITSLMYSVLDYQFCIVAGIMMILIDCSIVFMNIVRIEKESLIKILKGGCL